MRRGASGVMSGAIIEGDIDANGAMIEGDVGVSFAGVCRRDADGRLPGQRHERHRAFEARRLEQDQARFDGLGNAPHHGRCHQLRRLRVAAACAADSTSPLPRAACALSLLFTDLTRGLARCRVLPRRKV